MTELFIWFIVYFTIFIDYKISLIMNSKKESFSTYKVLFRSFFKIWKAQKNLNKSKKVSKNVFSHGHALKAF